MSHDSATRGFGGLMVGVAAALFAKHAGMPDWKVWLIAALVGVGIPLAISGKWKNW